jgi:multiple sugar transport system permease protein/putative chitobiose transport system permease protein
LAFAAPFLWIAITSIRPPEEAIRYVSPFQWQTLLPSQVTLDNYVDLFTGPFLRAISNSLIVSVASVIIGLVVAAAAAYVFATVTFRGRNLLFALVVFSFMVPFEVLAVPLSSAVRDLGLANTYVALILPGLGNGLAVFLLRQFFLGVPIELSEAASLDGASWATTFWRIYLPLSGPALISAGLIIFLFQWQAYLWPLLITTDRSMDVGSVAIARFFGQSYDANYGLIFAAAAVLSLVPATLLLRFQRHFTAVLSLVPATLLLRFQRHFIESAAKTGLKG